MKRAYEDDKENMYKQKMEEIEKLKFEIYNQRESKEELNELRNLKEKIANSTGMNGAGTQNLNTVNQNFYTLNNNYNNTMQQNNLVNASQQSINQNQPHKRLFKIISYNRKDKINEYDAKNEIERLSKERDMLLNGVYQENDPIIVQLENKIKRLLQSSQENY